MGMFDVLFRRSTPATSKNQKANQKERVSSPPVRAKKKTPLVLEGAEERTVYTYDPKPLKGIRKGSVFYADVVMKRTKLVSPTGSEWDTGKDGIAFAVNGSIFGSSNALNKTFRELSKAGYAVKVKMKRLGMYDQYVPQIIMLIPSPEEIFRWRDACKALGREIPFEDRNTPESINAAANETERYHLEKATGSVLPLDVEGAVMNFDEQQWLGSKPLSGQGKLHLTTSWIATPEGSKAKPRISIMEDGIQIEEVAVRNKSYAVLSRYVGQKPFLATCRKCESLHGDGSHYWKIAIVYRKAVEDA